MKKDKFQKYVWLIGAVIVCVVAWWLFVGPAPVAPVSSTVPAVPSIHGPDSGPGVNS